MALEINQFSLFPLELTLRPQGAWFAREELVANQYRSPVLKPNFCPFCLWLECLPGSLTRVPWVEKKKKFSLKPRFQEFSFVIIY